MNEVDMNRIIKIFGVSIACVFVLNFLGCGTSQPSHFYLLRSLSPDSVSGLSEPKQSNISLGLGPITFPKYLDRPQIVTKASAHEVELAEFHKWAEPLNENVSHVLAENLSALLSTDRIVQYPWKRPDQPDYQLSLNVIQLDGKRNQEAILKVRWTLTGDEGNTLLLQKTSQFSEILRSPEYEELVEAMSHMLASLSEEIAAAIKSRPVPLN
jgi:uncharacterized lipoprotein YmbA